MSHASLRAKNNNSFLFVGDVSVIVNTLDPPPVIGICHITALQGMNETCS